MTSPIIMPGLHPGLTREQYDAIEAVNQSSLKVLIERSPAHFRHAIDNPEPPSDALRFGQAVHLACYEPARFAAEVVEMPAFDRRTKIGKEEAAAWEAENAGRIAIDRAEYQAIAAIQRAVLEHPTARRSIAKAGHREATIVWDDAETGVRCKARADHVILGAGGPMGFFDLKTTRNAAPWAFQQDAFRFGYHVQAAFYIDGLAAACGVTDAWFCLIAVEKEPPYAAAVYEYQPEAIELGRIHCRRALATYAECVKSGRWPGYSESIEPLSVPAWALRLENVETQEVSQ